MAGVEMQPPSTTEGLENVSVLVEVPPDRLQVLAEKCRWLRFFENQVVIERDEFTTDVYFVISGRLRAVDFMGGSDEVALADLGPGDTFGELSALDQKARSARVVALEPAELAVLSSADFRQLLIDCPGMALALLKRFAGVIRTMNTRVTSLSSVTPHQRVYMELLRLSQPKVDEIGSWIIVNAPNHEQLASSVGANREIVADAIGKLAREGIIMRKYRNLVIKDHDRLQRLASQK